MKNIAAVVATSVLGLQTATIAAQTTDAALEEIIVTAQRRQENLQDVPIAISAMTGQMLQDAGVRDPRDLQAYVPSLQFQSGTAATTTIIFLRGVGIGDFNANTTGAVGVYVDDVFLGANSGKLFDVFDGEGVEVLRGPQGTLYGRNTTGGAIKFTSRKPTDELSTDLSVLYGRYNEVRLEGGIGGPIIEDKLKIRVSGLYNTRDGWMRNRVTGHELNDVDLWAARAISTSRRPTRCCCASHCTAARTTAVRGSSSTAARASASMAVPCSTRTACRSTAWATPTPTTT